MSEPPIGWKNGDFEVTTDHNRLNLDLIHQFLTRDSYWAKGIPRPAVEKAVRNSLCFSLLHGDLQIGFARVISDLSTIAYLGDVFVPAEYRGHGLAKWLMECVVSHPDLQSLRRWILLTKDAHGLYRKFNFTPLADPAVYMERHDSSVYLGRTGGLEP